MSEPAIDSGASLHRWAADLFPICRNVAGEGGRHTLAYLKDLFPGFELHHVPSGTKAFDWTVPDEWNIRSAWLEHEDGTRVADFAWHNLHVVGYSEPVDRWIGLDALQEYLHSIPGQPEAIPYASSVYRRTWGFCLADRVRRGLKPGRYRAFIDSTLAPGHLTYAEAILPGQDGTEVLLSTYADHPSMGNNELSGPVVLTAVARWLASLPERRHTYRLVIAPETIGSILYLSRNLERMRGRTVAGFVLTCIGDDRTHSMIATPHGDTLTDRVARYALKRLAPDNHHVYDFTERGSDERQYCSPGAGLPVVTLMRSKFGTFPEYHTSRDDLSVITPEGLAGGFALVRSCIEALEANRVYRAPIPGEPQLGRRGLYPTTMKATSGLDARPLTNLLAFADGRHDLLWIAERIGTPIGECATIAATLAAHGLLVTEDAHEHV